MNVLDVYFELNRFNRANLREDGLKVPDFIDENNTVAYNVYPTEQRFILVGINSMGQVFMNGFCNKGRRINLEYRWRQEAGCKYFLICTRRNPNEAK